MALIFRSFSLYPSRYSYFGNDVEVMTPDIIVNYQYVFEKMNVPKESILFLTTEHGTAKKIVESVAVESVLVDRYETFIKRAYYW